MQPSKRREMGSETTLCLGGKEKLMYEGLKLDDCPVKLALHTILDEFQLH